MAIFTSTARLDLKWRDIYHFRGAAGTEFRVDDGLQAVFDAEFTGLIPGLTWVDTDELGDLTDIETDITALEAADAVLTAGKVSISGSTMTGNLHAPTVFAQKALGMIDASRYSSLAAALLAGAGGSIYMPEGTYALSANPGTIASNTRLFGAGRGTVITMSGNAPILQAANSASGIIIQGLRLVGSATSASSSQFGVYAPTGCADIVYRDLWIEGCFRGVAIASSARVTVDNVRVLNDMSDLGAIDVNASTEVTVINARVTSPRVHGIDFREGGGYHAAIDCVVRSAGNTGFVISGSASTGTSIFGVELKDCKSIGAGVTDTANGCGFIIENGATNCRISTSLSSAAALDGFLVGQGTGDAPANNVLAGCIARSAGRNGFNLFQALYTDLTGCRATVFGLDGFRVGSNSNTPSALSGCIATDGTTTTGAGFRVQTSGEGTTLTGCIAKNNAGYGFYIDVNKTVLAGCSAIDNDSGGTLTIGGITLSANADRSTVTGCQSFRVSGTKQDYGILVEAGCVSANLVGNQLVTNTTGALSDLGTTTGNTGNIVA